MIIYRVFNYKFLIENILQKVKNQGCFLNKLNLIKKTFYKYLLL